MRKTGLILAALTVLIGFGAVGCTKSESEETGRKLGTAVRGATEDVKDSASKVADGVKESGKDALQGVKDFGKGIKEGWKSSK